MQDGIAGVQRHIHMCGQGKGARWDLAGFQFAHLQVAIFFAQRECTLVVVAVREAARHAR